MVRSSSKRQMIGFLKIIFALVILLYLIYKTQLKLSLLNSVLNNPLLVILVIILLFTILYLSAYRWHILNNKQRLFISLKNTLVPTYIGTAFNNVLPGGVGGDFVRLHYLFKHFPDKKNNAMISILFDRITGLVSIFFIILISALMLLLNKNISSQSQNILISFSILSGFCLAIFFLILNLPISNWRLFSFITKYAGKRLIDLFKAMKIYRDEGTIILNCCIVSVLIQLMITMTLMVLSKAMCFPMLSFSCYALAAAVTQIVNLLPLSPGGIGVGEIAFANILLVLNPNLTYPFATVFLTFRLIGFLIYLPGVILYLLVEQNGFTRIFLEENAI